MPNFEVEVTVPKPLDQKTRQFLESARRSASRVVRFRGDGRNIHLTVQATGVDREEILRSAVGEVARMFPDNSDEKYGEPRQMTGT